MRDPLLTQAALLYDSCPALQQAALKVRGFGGGAEWMRLGLTVLRGTPPEFVGPARIGWLKYIAATAAAATWVVFALMLNAGWIAPVAVLIFYAVEAQMVFVFPAAIDGAERPFVKARALTLKAGGTLTVMSTVVPIAVSMLSGGFAGRGFIRSWCIGCLAVCVWYDRLQGEL